MPLDYDENGEPVTPELDTTEPVENQPEPTPEQDEKPAQESDDDAERAQKGVQKRIDRLTRQKYEAQAEAAYLRKMIDQAQSQNTESVGILRENYSSEAEYLDAALEQRAAEREANSREMSYHEKRQSILEDAEDAGVDLESFRKVRAITKPMAEAIVESDVPVKLIAYFTENPDEAVEISKLSPARQAAAIGKLEDRIASEPVRTAAKTAAPAPIKPLNGKGGTPRGLSDEMSMADWLAERNKQVRNR